MARTPPEWMMVPLRRYAVFTGRARRAEYWWFTLLAFMLVMVPFLPDLVVDRRIGALSVVRRAIMVALIVPQVAVAFRRLHDVGRTGWWAIAPAALLVPAAWGTMASMTYGVPTYGGALPAAATLCWLAALAAGIVVIVWTCTRGTDGPNRFGPDPLADEITASSTD